GWYRDDPGRARGGRVAPSSGASGWGVLDTRRRYPAWPQARTDRGQCQQHTTGSPPQGGHQPRHVVPRVGEGSGSYCGIVTGDAPGAQGGGAEHRAGGTSRHVQRIQKTLEEANIKLDSVITDIMGLSGRRMIEAMLNGITNPWKLADLADRRIKASRKELYD